MVFRRTLRYRDDPGDPICGPHLQLYEDIFAESLEPMFLDRLELAKSNIPENKNGRIVYEKFVKPSVVDSRKIAAHYALRSLFGPHPEHERIYCYSVDLHDLAMNDTGRTKLAVGCARNHFGNHSGVGGT